MTRLLLALALLLACTPPASVDECTRPAPDALSALHACGWREGVPQGKGCWIAAHRGGHVGAIDVTWLVCAKSEDTDAGARWRVTSRAWP